MTMGGGGRLAAAVTPERSVQSPPPTRSPSQESILLSGVYDSRVFLMRCPLSARGHDLRELVKTQLAIECPALQLRVVDLKQEDGDYAREEDAVVASGREIRYTVKVSHLFPADGDVWGGEGRVQFRVERAHVEHAATVVDAPSPTTRSRSAMRPGPSGKRVHTDSTYDEGVKDEKFWESSWITQEDVDHLERIKRKMQRVIKDGECAHMLACIACR